MLKRFAFPPVLLFGVILRLGAYDDLSDEQLKLLQDPDGWEYTKLSDATNGIQTEHTCFDGSPHPDACSGKLIVKADNTFIQQVTIEGKDVSRHGTWQLDSDQLAFFDEYGTRDGPYTIEIDAEKKSMVMHMPQVRMELKLESEYKKEQQQSN